MHVLCMIYYAASLPFIDNNIVARMPFYMSTNPLTALFTTTDQAIVTIVEAPNNTPAGISGMNTNWTDESGNFLLFGGQITTTTKYSNDLWRYNSVTNSWRWVAGSVTITHVGVYGNYNVESMDYIPGTQSGSAGWVDGNGAL